MQDIGSSSHVRSEVICDVGMLDLRYAKTQADLAGIKKITDVGGHSDLGKFGRGGLAESRYRT